MGVRHPRANDLTGALFDFTDNLMREGAAPWMHG